MSDDLYFELRQAIQDASTKTGLGFTGGEVDTLTEALALRGVDLIGFDQAVIPREPTPEMLRVVSTLAERIKISPEHFLEMYAVIVKAAELESTI